MPTNDIIDNRTEKLSDHIRRMLTSTKMARFAVGYFFLSGLEAIADRLDGVSELRLLIGNTTNQETVDQLAEGHRRLQAVADEIEAQHYPKDVDKRRMMADTASDVRAALEEMDQTDAAEQLIGILAKMIADKRLSVRVYTKGRLHAKAYIFTYRSGEQYESGNAIIGSSNLTLAGVTHNTELNVVVPGAGNHDALCQWFDTLWDEASDFDTALMQVMKQSWAAAPTTPYDIYMKTLYALVQDRLEGSDDEDILWDDDIINELADFQKVAVRQATRIIRDYDGVFVSDVVGLGKSFIGAAIIKQFERTEHARPVIICPAPLVPMWNRYNLLYSLNAAVVSMGTLLETDDSGRSFLVDDPLYRDRDFVLIDESHNLRHSDTERYRVVERFLATGRRCCFLTATPRNKSAMDVYRQIKLFHQDDVTNLPVDPPNLRDYFRAIENGTRHLPDLLSHILIRRTRNHILRWYGFDAETDDKVDPMQFNAYLSGVRRAYVKVGGKKQFFPKRELETIEYSIEDTYNGLYQQLRGYLGKPRASGPAQMPSGELTYARYSLWHYVAKGKQRQEPYVSLHRAGANLHGLMRVLLFKRLESSVYAFQQTIGRLLAVHRTFLAALNEGIVPAGDKAQALLYESDIEEESDLLDALRAVSTSYSITDFNADRLRADVAHDIGLLEEIAALVAPITAAEDAKLATLRAWLARPPLQGGKRLIFTQYADTARYLFENLKQDTAQDDIDVAYSSGKDKFRVVGRFAPIANPAYQPTAGETELRTVIATDVLAEGLNLQDCNNVINYDLHWNPVRLIQRFGRIDRIGSEHDKVYAFNFLPETNLERNLGLRQKLRLRIQEIHETIGEDAAILDKTEELNEEAMYAMYERQDDQQISLFAGDEEPLGLSEAEEILRELKANDPDEYTRISNLPDGIRSARYAAQRGRFVFCQAGRYQQLYLLGNDGRVVTRDIPQILGAIRCGPDLSGLPLPDAYNAGVMAVKEKFAEEVQQREAERGYSSNLSLSQQYVVRELRRAYAATDDENMRAQIAKIEKAFRSWVTTPITRDLNRLRRNGVTGQNLLRALEDLFFEHKMDEWQERQAAQREERPIPRIVCSEALV